MGPSVPQPEKPSSDCIGRVEKAEVMMDSCCHRVGTFSQKSHCDPHNTAYTTDLQETAKTLHKKTAIYDRAQQVCEK